MPTDAEKAEQEIQRAKAELEKALGNVRSGAVQSPQDLKKVTDAAKALLDINGIC